MLPALAEFGVDLVIVKYDGGPRGAARTGDERAWFEDGRLFVRDRKGTPRVIADDLGDRVESVSSNDDYVCVCVQRFEETRLFRRSRSTFREVEMPDFDMPIVDAAIIDDLLVVRLFSGPTGDEPEEEMNALYDNMQLVLIGHDLRASADRWEWEHPFDGGLLEPWRVTRTHVYSGNDPRCGLWSVRARDGQVNAVDESLTDWYLGTGSLFGRSSTGLAWWNADEAKIEALIVTDDAQELAGVELGENLVLVHSKTVTTLLQKKPRRALAANAHEETAFLERVRRVNDRWEVRATSHRSRELRPATAAQAARWEKPIERIELDDTVLSREINRAKVVTARAHIDEARWRAISQVVAEEGAAIESARERLVAQGIISADFDPRSIAVSATSDGRERFRWWTKVVDGDASALLLWATLAHDEAQVRAALATVREFSARMQRIGGIDAEFSLEFARGAVSDSFMHGHWRGHAVRMLSDVVDTGLAPLHHASMVANPSGYLQRAQALWQIASRRGSVVPPGYNSALTGTPFEDVRSPFEPLLTLSSVGYPLRGMTSDSVLLSLPVFTALHEPTREDIGRVSP